ncbi:MAG TPA: hypothetical protein VF506_03975 [Streptosporangiaceae bacterium]
MARHPQPRRILMHDAESGQSAATVSPTIRPAVAEVIRGAKDARLSAGAVAAAVQHAVTAWVKAVAGEDAALAAMAGPQVVWPAIEDVAVRALGAGDWQPSLNWIDVIELWPE